VARAFQKSWAFTLITSYKWREDWRLQGEVVPAFEKEPNGWEALPTSHQWCWRRWPEWPLSSAPTAGSGACFPSRGERWPSSPGCQCPKPVADDGRQKELEKAPRPGPAERSKPSKRSCSARRRPIGRKMAALLVLRKSGRPSARRRGRPGPSTAHRRRGNRADRRGEICRWRQDW